MACSIFQLSFGASPLSTYSFVDCFSNTITFVPEPNGVYICWADNSTPPPPSIDLNIVEGILESPSYKRFDDCCGNFSLLMYTDNIPLTSSVISSDLIITTSGNTISGTSEVCLSWNSTGDTTELTYISLFKIPSDYYQGNDCSECLLTRPCITPTPTPTPTTTPTPTPTPTPVYQPITPKFINECEPITLFPMGVSCSVVHPSPYSSDGVASLIITGGTPPYYVSWENGNISPIIYNLSAGSYKATIIDSYGDFTANTTCVLTGSTPTPSMTPTPTPTSPYIEYDLCMVTNILKNGSYVESQVNFSPNGVMNSKASWLSDDSSQKIYWDSTVSQWRVSAATPTTYVISNSNPAYPPIYGSWYIVGATGSVIVYDGPCTEGFKSEIRFSTSETIQPLTVTITKNETICGCDGGLTIATNGGVSPYSYSINGGLTFRNIPLFSNLCSGAYNVVVRDKDGRVVNTNIVLNPPSPPTTYNVKLITTSRTLESNTTTLSKELKTTLSVTPKLPDGVNLTFSLNHLNISKSSPNEDSSSSSTSTVLTIDEEIINPSSDSISNDSIINTVAGCQSENVWLTSYNEIWGSITINSSTNFEVSTLTTVNRNEIINCYVGTSDDIYSITNLKITGCNCCSVILS